MRTPSVHTGSEGVIGPAPRAAAVVAVLGLAATGAAFANALPLPLRCAIALIMLIVAARAVAGLIWPRWRRITVDGDRFRAEAGSGQCISGMLAGRPFVSPVFVGLRWREEGTRMPRTVGIFREQMPTDDFRRLCAALRFPEPA